MHLLEKLKLYRREILGGVLGVLVFAGAIFAGYKFGQRQISPELVKGPTLTPELVATPTPELTPTLVGAKLKPKNYYVGKVSPRIPYKDLKFLEIDVHDFKPLYAQLDENDYHYEDSVIDGYTFVAKEGEDFEFVAYEDRDSNPGSFVETELYGWGPTVIRMGTVIGWGVPVTGRYFYVVKGKDFYGPNFIAPDGTTYDGSKYGRYRLEITQRK